jgi:hypothetical protein
MFVGVVQQIVSLISRFSVKTSELFYRKNLMDCWEIKRFKSVYLNMTWMIISHWFDWRKVILKIWRKKIKHWLKSFSYLLHVYQWKTENNENMFLGREGQLIWAYNLQVDVNLPIFGIDRHVMCILVHVFKSLLKTLQWENSVCALLFHSTYILN